MIPSQNIIDLFGGINDFPQLSDLTVSSSWAESQMPEILRRFVKEKGSYHGNPRGQSDMWTNMYDTKSGSFNIFPTLEEEMKRKDFVWKAHGPTAMPGAARMQIPEIGGFVSGADPRAKELDFVITNHMNKVRGQLNSQSYTCQLIAKEHMNDCYPHNYAALSTEKDGIDPAAACESMGCCYNELNFFADELLPVCYRSLRSGYCDPVEERGTGSINDKFWENHPFREPCGEAGANRFECLSQNGYCCFDTAPRREGDSFCYRRGGVEGQINPYTKSKGEVIDECRTIDVTQRVNCFTANKWGNLLNRMGTETHCAALGCCFDPAAAEMSSKMSLFGSTSLVPPHCYRGPGDLDNTFVNSNYRQLPRYNVNQLLKVCANDPKWPKLQQRKWGMSSSGRYELNDASFDRPLSREPCLQNGQRIYDRHQCVYFVGCCYEKSPNPIDPWCYKSRIVIKN